MIPLSDDAGRRRRFPFVMLTILAANIFIFGYEIWLGPDAEDMVFDFGLVPYRLSHPSYYGWDALMLGYLTLFTAMFLHGGLLHLGGNMLYLWVFGDSVEDRLGHMGFLFFYVLAGAAGNLAHTIVLADSHVPSIGASGAIAGVLAAYMVLFPKARVRTLLILGIFITFARIPALLLIGFWAVLQFVSGIVSLNPLATQPTEVAYWAHIGGFLIGLATVKRFSKPGRR